MSTKSLPIRIDPDIFLFKDSRVEQLRSARLSVRAFALLVKPGDPYLLVDDTLCALTEKEYWAIQAVQPPAPISPAIFEYVLNAADLSFMHKGDKELVERIRKASRNCSGCAMKNYMSQVQTLIKRYSIQIPEAIATVKNRKGEEVSRHYPETTGQVTCKVSKKLSDIFKVPVPERTGCLDCVEKHIAQAWVLSNECLNGYPEHLIYVVGHLGEAIAETPKEYAPLKDALIFCLAKTNQDKTPFVPLGPLANLVNMCRTVSDQTPESLMDMPDNGNDNMPLDLTDEMRAELKALDNDTAAHIARLCRDTANFTLGVENSKNMRFAWEGAMAVAADELAPLAPKTASMLRNRRLLFFASPELARESGYGAEDVAELLENVAAGNGLG